MKASYSILAAAALLAVAALGTPGVHAGQNPVTRHTHMNNHSYSFQSIPDSKSHRALRSMDTPKQGPIHNGKQKHPHHDDPQQNDTRAHRALLGADGIVSIQRTLGQAPVTPATTTTSSSKVTPAATTTKATPAPTTPHNKPKLTPAPTKTKPKATPASTTTSSTSKNTPAQTLTKPKVTPAATKATPVPSTTKPKTPTPKTVKPKTTPAATTSKDKTPVPTKASSSKVTPSPTTSKSTTTGKISDVVQQKTRSLGEDQTEQQQQRSHDYKQGAKLKSKNGGKHHKQM